MSRASILTISDTEEHRGNHMYQTPDRNSRDLADYEAVPQIPNYINMLDYENIEKREYTYLDDPSDVYDGPMSYDLPLTSSNSSAVTIYQDPGYSKEILYEWLDKMKLRKIRSNNIT